MPEIIITEPGGDPESHQFELKQDVIRIGRGGGNDIVTKSSRTSAEHCTIERVEGGYIMRDAGSTNGIKLEKTRMETVDLQHRTVVSMGDVLLEFRLSREERKKERSSANKNSAPISKRNNPGTRQGSKPPMRAALPNRPGETGQTRSRMSYPLHRCKSSGISTGTRSGAAWANW